MALQLSFTDDRGFTSPTAYFRVIHVEAGWLNKHAVIFVHIYKDQQARDDGKRPMGQLRFQVVDAQFDALFSIDTLSSADNNPVRSVYSWLKSKPEFSGATDV